MERQTRHWSLILAGFVLLAALLAGCGANQPSPLGSGKLTLTCSTVVWGHDVDVVTARLTCRVSGAPASEASFSLTYHVTAQDARSFPFSAACHGTLTNGAGSCVQSYSAPAPIPVTPASVSGETAPSHITLGPVTPTEHDATPAPGQHL
jgi:hypothetical protein